MSIDKCLEPSPGSFVLDLHDMCQGHRTVGSDEIFKCRRMIVEPAIESILSRFDGCVKRNRGSRGSDACYEIKKSINSDPLHA